MIYVDELIFKKKNGKKCYCHMFADSVEELHEFADLIGRKRCWYHKSSTGIMHYDLDEKFRTLALENGASVISTKDALKKFKG